MRKIALIAALAAAPVVIPSAASAQQRVPAAVVAVVDTNRIANECTACRSAAQQLLNQQNALRSRAQTLQQQLQTEGKPLQDAVEALPEGRQPDAALQQRITAYQTKTRNAQQELATAQDRLQSTQAHVNQQISQRLGPIISQIAASKGATIALDKSATIYSAPSVDITADVLAQLNRALPSVSVTPLPQQAQPQQQRPTQGR